MKIFNKIVWSSKEPNNHNDVWFDGSTFQIYNNGTWESVTLEIAAAEKVAEVIKNASNVYQEKLIDGKGIKLEGNVISTTPLFKLVENLPEIGDEDTIYLLVLEDFKGNNKLAEYIYINDEWEQLGGEGVSKDYVDGKLTELSKKLEAEDVATTEPTAEFPQLLYTPQTLTEAQKSQARKNIGVGEGGSDGEVELVEFIYLFDQELSEEQVAINAASYAKIASGGNYIPYVKTNDGANLGVPFWGIDGGILALSIETAVFSLVGRYKRLILIDATGQIQVTPIPTTTDILFVDELTTYESLRETTIALIGENSVNLFPIRAIDNSDGMGWVDEIMVQDDFVILIYTTDYGVKYQIMGYGGEQKGITKSIIAGGTIYLGVTDPTSTEAKKNKMASFFYDMPHTFNIKVVNDDKDWSYTPLMIKSGEVVIYRNDTMEGWRINSDGTTTLSQ